jgi:hypothetical protein
MPAKTDRRRSRERRRRRAILFLHGTGCSITEIARKVGTSEKGVERVLEAAGIKELVSEEQRNPRR